MKLNLLHEMLSTAAIDCPPGGTNSTMKRRWKSKKQLSDDGYMTFLTPEKGPNNKVKPVVPEEKKSEGKKNLFKHKQINTMKQVWQPVVSSNSKSKTQDGFNNREIYASTVSQDHPYDSMGL